MKSAATFIGIDKAGMALLQSALPNHAIPSQSVAYGDAVKVLSHVSSSLIVVGIDQDPEAALGLGVTLEKLHPGAVSIALFEFPDPRIMRMACASRYRRALSLPADVALLRHLLASSPPQSIPNQSSDIEEDLDDIESSDLVLDEVTEGFDPDEPEVLSSAMALPTKVASLFGQRGPRRTPDGNRGTEPGTHTAAFLRTTKKEPEEPEATAVLAPHFSTVRPPPLPNPGPATHAPSGPKTTPRPPVIALTETRSEVPGRSSDRHPAGPTTVIMGCTGGCGATFLAIHIAVERSLSVPTCLVDLDTSSGDVAPSLGLSPKATLTQIVNLEDLDANLLRGSATWWSNQLALLPQPSNLKDIHELRGDESLQLLIAASEAFDHVIVDAGTRLDESTLSAVLTADRVLLVCTPEIPSVRNALRRLELLDSLGVSRDRVGVILNQWCRNAALTFDQVESILPVTIQALVARDEANCRKIAHQAATLQQAARRSPCMEGIRQANLALPVENLASDDSTEEARTTDEALPTALRMTS
ncbi:MAG: hypothetical protein QGG40_04195 [Myxococcota bacterium]|jgi:MinD-like ATPase involved in chromosome partitioning or flagellar assembly|nr:hypothetical protein [Myxococcota bacterium]